MVNATGSQELQASRLSLSTTKLQLNSESTESRSATYGQFVVSDLLPGRGREIYGALWKRYTRIILEKDGAYVATFGVNRTPIQMALCD